MSVPADPDISAETHIGLVVELSRRMQQHVVQAIDDIARINRATHMLSMNARVEAARAGETGRGFAVVAEELTRLSGEMKGAADQVIQRSQTIGGELDKVIGDLSTRVRENRLCDLALNAIDIVDRNLYERSCDVRWWATDSAVVQCMEEISAERVAHASRRLGQILDSYTVYLDLVLADLEGNVVANGRPRKYRSVGHNVAQTTWFRSALATADSTHFGFESMHQSELAQQERVLVYSCVIRKDGDVRGKPLGVLGILFNWNGLGQVVVKQVPLSGAEKQHTRAYLTDASGLILADSTDRSVGERLTIAGLDKLFRQLRGAQQTHLGARKVLVAQAASPGFETYRTGWHGVLVRQLD